MLVEKVLVGVGRLFFRDILKDMVSDPGNQ
jgi:hypothetical protein